MNPVRQGFVFCLFFLIAFISQVSAQDDFSCLGNCGGQASGGCWCDAADINHFGCMNFGDCCPDICEACPEVCNDSCEGFCGTVAPAGCYCDEFCTQYGDCCEDWCGECQDLCDFSCLDRCGEIAPGGCSCESDCFEKGNCCDDICYQCAGIPQCTSCVNYCGGRNPGGCWCDPADENRIGCIAQGDCCPDICQACPEVCNYSCAGFCGGVAPAGCYCDEFCHDYGDCCPDICDSCFVNDCLQCNGIIFSAFPHPGTVDARQPSLITDSNQLLGIGSVGEPIRIDIGKLAVSTNCFSLCETNHVGFAPNAIAKVTDLGDGSYEILLQRPITPYAVTTISYGQENSISYISHPANVNADSASSAVDILDLINILNGTFKSPWGLFSSDIDHSNSNNPADILREIDLLNGAGEFTSYMQSSLPTNSNCP